MKPTWNEGIEAYDREQATILAVQAEYDEWLRAVFEAARVSVETKAGVSLGDPSQEGGVTHDWGLDWADASLPVESSIDVAAWNGGCEGRPATIVLQLRLGTTTVDGSWPTPSDRLSLSGLADVVLGQDGPRAVLRERAFAMTAVEELGSTMARWIAEAQQANTRLAAGTGWAAAPWAAKVILAERAILLRSAAGGKVSEGEWQGGRYVQVDLDSGRAWITVFPDGRVVVSGGYKNDYPGSSGDQLVAAAGFAEREDLDRLVGAVALSPPSLAALHKTGDRAGLVRVLAEAFGRWWTAYMAT